jgi:hypothetical protein
MTHMSLTVLAYPEPLAEEALRQPSLANAVVERLDRHARRCGPYAVAQWAHAQGLPVVYVDNSWVRVPVSGGRLRAFSTTMLGLATDGDLVQRAVEDAAYLLEAEEF